MIISSIVASIIGKNNKKKQEADRARARAAVREAEQPVVPRPSTPLTPIPQATPSVPPAYPVSAQTVTPVPPSIPPVIRSVPAQPVRRPAPPAQHAAGRVGNGNAYNSQEGTSLLEGKYGTSQIEGITAEGEGLTAIAAEEAHNALPARRPFILAHDDLQRAVIMSEILGTPRARRLGGIRR